MLLLCRLASLRLTLYMVSLLWTFGVRTEPAFAGGHTKKHAMCTTICKQLVLATCRWHSDTMSGPALAKHIDAVAEFLQSMAGKAVVKTVKVGQLDTI